MSIITCGRCGFQVDSDFDIESMVDGEYNGAIVPLCPECRVIIEDELTTGVFAAKEAMTIDLTPTWSGLLPLMLECIAERGAHIEIRSEFVKMARGADQWNEHCKEEREHAAEKFKEVNGG